MAETSYTPFASEPDAVPVRLIVRRVEPTPGFQLALFATDSYQAFITDRNGDTLDLEADHRRHAEIENAIRDLKYGVELNAPMADSRAVSQLTLPGWRFKSSPTIWCAGRRASCWRAGGNHQDLTATLLLPGRAHHPQSSPSHPASPSGLALVKPIQQRPGPIAHPAASFLTPPSAFDLSTMMPHAWPSSARAGTLWSPAGDLHRKALPAPLPQAVNIPLEWRTHLASFIPSASALARPFPPPSSLAEPPPLYLVGGFGLGDPALRLHLGPSISPSSGCHTLCSAGLKQIKPTLSLSGSSHPFLPRRPPIRSVDWGLPGKTDLFQSLNANWVRVRRLSVLT